MSLLFIYLLMQTIIHHVAHKSIKIVDSGAFDLSSEKRDCESEWTGAYANDDKWDMCPRVCWDMLNEFQIFHPG